MITLPCYCNKIMRERAGLKPYHNAIYIRSWNQSFMLNTKSLTQALQHWLDLPFTTNSVSPIFFSTLIKQNIEQHNDIAKLLSFLLYVIRNRDCYGAYNLIDEEQVTECGFFY